MLLENILKNKLFNIKMLCLTFIIYISLNLKLDIVNITENTSVDRIILETINNLFLFNEFSILTALSFPMIYAIVYYSSTLKPLTRINKVISFLFVILLMLGYSYEKSNSWTLVFSTYRLHWLKIVIIIYGGYNLTNCIFRIILNIFENQILIENIKKIDKFLSGINLIKMYNSCIQKNLFVTCFLTFIILFMPFVLLSYPGIFMGDTWFQIAQYYPETNAIHSSIKDRLIDSNVLLNTHHPIAHTLLLNIFIKIGNGDRGVFLYVLFQCMVVFLIVSYCIKIAKVSNLIKTNVEVFFIIVYYLFNIYFHNYITVITKDTLYSAFGLLMMISMLVLLRSFTIKNFILFIVSNLLFMLFRNEGKIVSIVLAFLIFILAKNKKRIIYLFNLLFLLLFLILFNKFIKLNNITKGSVREVFSVPFQQTSRYLKYYNDLSSNEIEIINKVLDYEYVKTHYDPNNCDPAKATFKETASTENLKSFFELYLTMFRRHPQVFVEAFINKNHRYFYPHIMNFYSFEASKINMVKTNNYVKIVGLNFSYPSNTEVFRRLVDNIRHFIRYAPFFRLFSWAMLYVWESLLIFLLQVIKRNKNMILVMSYPLLIILACMFGPENAQYSRYVLPLVFSFPFVFLLHLNSYERIEYEANSK